jgi:nucleoside-diphosphate-sugar epimerase
MITIAGAGGFIGGNLVKRLRDEGTSCAVLDRDSATEGADLGTLVYAAGVTSDFRTRPFDTVDAHVATLLELVRSSPIERLVYLSSTRVYRTSASTDEAAPLTLDLGDEAEALYDLSKVLGERVACAVDAPTYIARLSNVYGPGAHPQSLLGSLVHGAAQDGRVQLRTSPESAKDHVHVDDVVDVLAWMTRGDGPPGIYNVASGVNRTARELLEVIGRCVPVETSVPSGTPPDVLREISIAKLSAARPFAPRDVLDDLPELIASLGESR